MFDRRTSGRVSYPFPQRMRSAEDRSEAEIATDFDFQLFHDVALGGCSFWSDRPRQGQRLWIELGFEHERLTRLAEVCHETEIRCLARPMFLVGCRFLQPIKRGPVPATSTYLPN
jgi:hypothetical protein